MLDVVLKDWVWKRMRHVFVKQFDEFAKSASDQVSLSTLVTTMINLAGPDLVEKGMQGRALRFS